MKCRYQYLTVVASAKLPRQRVALCRGKTAEQHVLSDSHPSRHPSLHVHDRPSNELLLYFSYTTSEHILNLPRHLLVLEPRSPSARSVMLH